MLPSRDYNISLLILCVSLFIVSCHLQQYGQHDKDDYTSSIALIPDALSEHTFPISIDDFEVQAYFDQGMQLMYAYGKDLASRSFREAWQRDSTCAICYWGEAYALGPNINSRRSDLKDKRAIQAIRIAQNLAKKGHADEKEEALIEAMMNRYDLEHSELSGIKLDSLYSAAMEEVYTKFPNDIDIANIYAESLMLLLPWTGSKNLINTDVHRVAELLESILAETTHPGTCHHYIHIIESTEEPGRGLDCANYLSTAMPGASHINHMPSHIWNQLGMWDQSVRASLNAHHADVKAEKGLAFSIYPHHNIHMLLFAAAYDGQGAIAMQAAQDHSKLIGHQLYESLILLRFGRFDEILELQYPPKFEIGKALYDFSFGYAHLRMGDTNQANRILQKIKRTAEQSEQSFHRQSAGETINIVAGILEGEILRLEGKHSEAIKAFEISVEWYDQLNYSEPELFPFSPRHWLGDMLLEENRFEEAEQVYLEDLTQHPNNGWSLFGLKQVLKAQNKIYDQADDQFMQSWERSDTWIYSSRF